MRRLLILFLLRTMGEQHKAYPLWPCKYISFLTKMPMAQEYLLYPASFPSQVIIISSFVFVPEKKVKCYIFKHHYEIGRTCADKLITTPSFILLTSSYVRTRSYIAIIAPKLTDCIVKLSCIPWTSKSCSISRWKQSWTRDCCKGMQNEHIFKIFFRENFEEQDVLF